MIDVAASEENAGPTENSFEDLLDLILTLVRKLVELLFDFIDVGLDDIAYDLEAKFVTGGDHVLLLSLLHPCL